MDIRKWFKGPTKMTNKSGDINDMVGGRNEPNGTQSQGGAADNHTTVSRPTNNSGVITAAPVASEPMLMILDLRDRTR